MNEKKYDLYINRELSWLKFNERVLDEADNAANPVYERLRFSAIYCSNLDEFYMVRMGSLLDQTLLKAEVKESRTGMTPQEQIDSVNQTLQHLKEKRDRVYWDSMMDLSAYNIVHSRIANLNAEEKCYLETYFMNQIFPLVSPQIIDRHHPFPFLENKKLYIGVHILSKNNNIKLGIVPIDKHFDRIIFIPHQTQMKFVLIEELIHYFIDKIFNEKSIVDKIIFRITRNADINVEDDIGDVDIDYREVMQELLKKRRKLAAVRLEVYISYNTELIRYLCKKLELDQSQVFLRHAPLDMGFIFHLENKLPPLEDLVFKPLKPQQPVTINKLEPMYKQIQKRDILLHYPYDSMSALIRLLEESAIDPEVISIKITLYRVARDSKIINALVNAAEKGIEVNVVVELRARFDEENNIEWSKQLEEAGCKVIYGIVGFKIHSKLLLITRKSGHKITYITHVGTGNFNEKTAKIYTDIALLTAHKEIGIEASTLFNSLFMGEFVKHAHHLLVAPKCFKNRIIELIDQEIAHANQGQTSEIILKVNSLTDKIIINKLIEASQAGVKVIMIIRGICCVRAGIEGYTHNMTVISIVGRFLEHSRIYVFGSKERAQIFISSGDFMTRNTERRVEVAVPIYDAFNKQEILEWLNTMMRDNVKARVQNSDGTYSLRSTPADPLDSQLYFYEAAYKKSAQKQDFSLPPKSKFKIVDLIKNKLKHLILKKS
ncbi:polyphosphate kinase 1 [Cellulosilyticum sp. I15G10I2]|uniref:polyphosphate kinase 1 n=1 Tax=Cellulosilyticum sp. I15G10I2 TaxID=1892843 RepID=UPI00085C4E3D|nr:polyphosphate kinase 1 [Cellulosilyticum sp. I15G10I2]